MLTGATTKFTVGHEDLAQRHSLHVPGTGEGPPSETGEGLCQGGQHSQLVCGAVDLLLLGVLLRVPCFQVSRISPVVQ